MEVYFKEFQEDCEHREGGIKKDFCIILKENNDPYFETDVTCYEANCPFNKINSTYEERRANESINCL